MKQVLGPEKDELVSCILMSLAFGECRKSELGYSYILECYDSH